jgi:alginate O-acetyltransferase complex protein AlgI
MLFNTFDFFIYFPIVAILYFVLPHKWRWLHLLVASSIFYMFFIPVYILILIFTIIVDYVAGLLIFNTTGSKRKLYLTISIVANVGILMLFKYVNFFVDNINSVLHFAHATSSVPYLNIILPIGLSFHTFQAMSYTIEVYRNNQKPERHFGIYALYVMFFPQLVAGPIERPQNVLHQFHERHSFSYADAAAGIRQIVWGLLYKSVMADRLADIVDPVFNNLHGSSTLQILIACILFPFQIYGDFAGYSHIALGTARVMGFRLMMNFNRPYRATTVTEFWKRWHISLSSWFRDYLYISLGGNRAGEFRIYVNLFIVFLVSGFWHGANWTYVVWGALHGTYIVIERIASKRSLSFFRGKTLYKSGNLRLFSARFLTFVLVSIAWVFFRANNLSDVGYLFSRFAGLSHEFSDILHSHGNKLSEFLPLEVQYSLPFCILIIACVELIHWYEGNDNIYELLVEKPALLRWCIYFFAVFAVYYCGVFTQRQFIYFQF